MIQLNQKIAENIAETIRTAVDCAVFHFADGSTTNCISCTKDISHDEANKLYYVHLAFVVVLSSAKTVDKISFYNSDGALLFEDVNLEISLSAGENYFEEKLKIQYT